VDDDGTGFPAEPAGGGMGLGNMRARAEAVGGTLAVTSQPGQGTLVRMSIPRVITAGDDIGYYRRGMLFGGVGLLFWVAFVVWSAREQSPVTLILNVPIGLFLAVVLARKTAGYLRLRRQRKVR